MMIRKRFQSTILILMVIGFDVESFINNIFNRNIPFKSQVSRSKANHFDNNNNNNNNSNQYTSKSVLHKNLNWINFVIKFKLCPWASKSLEQYQNENIQQNGASEKQSFQSVNFKTIELRNNDKAEMEIMKAVEDAAKQMVEAEILFGNTNIGEDQYRYNPKVAITFLTFVPHQNNSLSNDVVEIIDSFESFHDLVVFMEEEYLPTIPVKNDDGEESSLVDHVALAGFHPDWEYSSEIDDKDMAAISYEKKSPFPTVTLVHWSAIDESSLDDDDCIMAQIKTEMISRNNAKILSEVGVSKLKNIYRKEVLGGG